MKPSFSSRLHPRLHRRLRQADLRRRVRPSTGGRRAPAPRGCSGRCGPIGLRHEMRSPYGQNLTLCIDRYGPAKSISSERAIGRALVLGSADPDLLAIRTGCAMPTLASLRQRYPRQLPARRGRGAGAAGRARRSRRCRAARRSRRTRGRSGARGARLVRSAADGGLPRRLRPLDQGGRGADVPGRGAAAGARRRDHRRPDPGQDRAAGLVGAFGRVELDPRQCLDLGADADRPGARRSRRRHRRARCAPWCGGWASR